MSKNDAWMPFYVGDYLSATGRLTTEQHGAYLLLILDYWKNGPPPNDDAVLAQITRLSPAAWRKARPAIVGFFDIKDGRLIQKRVEKERGRTVVISEERRKAGKIGAEKRWQTAKQNDGKPIANAMANDKQSHRQNDTQPQPPENNTHTSSLTTSREEPPEGITDAKIAFEYVCRAADWRPANDHQRQEGISVIAGWLALGCTLELVLSGISKARQRDPSPTRSLKRFDSTVRGQRRDQLGGTLPVTSSDVAAITDGIAKRLAVGGDR